MGLFSSSSKSSSTNTQTTNNVSLTTAFNQTGGGTAIWGSGNTIVASDAGAMDAARDIANAGAALVSDGFNAARNMSEGGFDAARDIAKTGANMVGGLFDKSADLADSVFRQSVGLAGDYARQMGQTANNAMDLVDDVNGKLSTMTGRAFDLSSAFAQDGAKLARDAMDYGGNLAREFSQSAIEASKTAQQTVLDGTKYALQFADNASRSDGQQYALSANKNQMYTMLGVAALVALVLFTRGK